MSAKRPFVWHASKFTPGYSGPHPWTVTFGRPKDDNDFRIGHTAATLEAAMEKARALAKQERRP